MRETGRSIGIVNLEVPRMATQSRGHGTNAHQLALPPFVFATVRRRRSHRAVPEWRRQRHRARRVSPVFRIELRQLSPLAIRGESSSRHGTCTEGISLRMIDPA
jgi:hypothetical protein